MHWENISHGWGGGYLLSIESSLKMWESGVYFMLICWPQCELSTFRSVNLYISIRFWVYFTIFLIICIDMSSLSNPYKKYIYIGWKTEDPEQSLIWASHIANTVLMGWQTPTYPIKESAAPIPPKMHEKCTKIELNGYHWACDLAIKSFTCFSEFLVQAQSHPCF